MLSKRFSLPIFFLEPLRPHKWFTLPSLASYTQRPCTFRWPSWASILLIFQNLPYFIPDSQGRMTLAFWLSRLMFPKFWFSHEEHSCQQAMAHPSGMQAQFRTCAIVLSRFFEESWRLRPCEAVVLSSALSLSFPSKRLRFFRHHYPPL